MDALAYDLKNLTLGTMWGISRPGISATGACS